MVPDVVAPRSGKNLHAPAPSPVAWWQNAGPRLRQWRETTFREHMTAENAATSSAASASSRIPL